MKTTTILFIVMTLLVTLAATAGTIRVPADAPTIQAGIDAAVDGDIVLLANGTYTGPGNRDVLFRGKAITVRSEYGPDVCIIDCSGLGRGFIFHECGTTDSRLWGVTIRNGQSPGGSGILCDNSSPLIFGCKILNNIGQASGGGIACVNSSSPAIFGCTIRDNRTTEAVGMGGGLYCSESTPSVFHCFIEGNHAESFGGGVYLEDCPYLNFQFNEIEENSAASGGGICSVNSTLGIINCLVRDNTASYGGGAHFSGGTLAVLCSTIAGNVAENAGGGIRVRNGDATVSNCIVWGNYAETDRGLDIGGSGATEVEYSDIQGGWSGTGNISADPLWIRGPLGDCYLSQTGAGQAVNSPCVNAGDPELVGTHTNLTTRTDCWGDGGVLDMGYHYAITGLVLGSGPGYDNPPRVRITPPQQDASHTIEFEPYGAPHYGTNVACGTHYTDRYMDILITGPGPGAIYGPHVRGFLVDGTPLPGFNFLAYGTSKFGVNVAAGNLDGDETDEILTGAGPGAVFGPHVRAFRYDGATVEPVAGVSFFAYGTHKWGVNVAAGDIDMDGYDEIITGAGPGPVFGAHVRGWNVDGGAVTPIPGVSFFAYGTPRWGVKVSCGDVDGDGIDEIITAPGPSPTFPAHIRGWNYDGDVLTEMPGLNFFAWSPRQARYGANVEARQDLDMDGRADMVVGAGPDPGMDSAVYVYCFTGDGVILGMSLQAFPAGWTHGATVSAGAF